MHRFILSLLATLLYPALIYAASVAIDDQTTVHFSTPTGWQVATEPPMSLQQIMAEHIAHDAAEKGYHPTEAQLLEAARKRLSINEVLLYNPQSNSYATIDFSRLRKGEAAPKEKSIKLSAKYAGESLVHEEGVSKLTSSSREYQVPGAAYAYRYDASYKHHDEDMGFSGVIGFASPYWFYFYCTDYKKDPADQQRIDSFLASITIERQ